MNGPIPLRLWPAGLLVVLMVGLRFVPGMFKSESDALMMLSTMGPLMCTVLLLIWWLAASRATGREKLLGLMGLTAGGGIALAISDPSMRSLATMLIWTVPMGFAGFALGSFLARARPAFQRVWLAIVVAAVGFGFSALLRNEGMWGHGKLDLQWRWSPSAEEQWLVEDSAAAELPAAPVEANVWVTALANPEWPGFRGPERSSRQRGVKFSADWKANPPEQIWKIPVGPGWSSFAVAGSFLFTQEQRGSKECVACYDAKTGKEIWIAEIEARFFDPLGGPGPRATPELSGGKLYVQGAAGDLLCLDPRAGSTVWHRNIGKVADRKPPTWGWSGSPLVIDGVVVVHVGGEGDKGTLAFDAENGELKWSTPAGDHAYSSAQAMTIGGRQVVVMLTNYGMRVLEPSSGKPLLEYDWKHGGYRALQPQLVGTDTVILTSGRSTGTRRVRLAPTEAGFSHEELWTSRNLKSDFNDFVVYDGNIYGFDGAIFACVDLENGDRKWKGGRYGKGQVLLLEDSGMLLVISERGEGVLLKATPDEHEELAKVQLLTGKTWNHPVVVGNRLFVRNGQEAACFALPSVPKN